MSQQLGHTRTRAQESSNAIERVYITMRHLFNRGFYKPMGISGTALREALLTLRPEIYGSIAEEKIELQEATSQNEQKKKFLNKEKTTLTKTLKESLSSSKRKKSLKSTTPSGTMS